MVFKMKEETREFIIQITFILSAFMFIFMLFFGLGYIIYHSEVQDQQIYNLVYLISFYPIPPTVLFLTII